MTTPERGPARSPSFARPGGADAPAAGAAAARAPAAPLSELEGLLEQASAGFSLLDLDGRYVSANHAYAEMLGYTPAELVGMSWRSTVHPDDLPSAEAAYGQMLRASEADFEARALRKDGSTFHKHVVIVKAHDGHGRHVGHHCLMEDLTELKETEHRLALTQARLQHLVASSPAVVCSREPAGDYAATFVSENVTVPLGYEARDFVSRHEFWLEGIHPEDAPAVLAALAHLPEQEHQIHEYRFRHKDGRYRWLRDELRLVRDASGRPLEIVGLWLDVSERRQAEEALARAFDDLERRVAERTTALQKEITERRHAEEALRESEERFRNLIEGSIQGILIERHRRPLFVNQAFATLLGYDSPAQVLALTSLEAHVVPHERPRLARYAEAYLRGEHAPVHYEYDAVRRDGSTITLANTVRVVIWDGEPAIQNTLIDVTERKHAERTLHAVIDAVPAIINAKDERSRYIFMNRYQAELYGVRAEDAVGRTASELLDADYGAYTHELDRRVLETGKVIPYFEERYRDAHGVLRTFLTTKVPLEVGGGVRNVATVSLDVTRRRQAQEALQASEARYHALYDDNPSMFFTLDVGGMILSTNRFGAEQLGYTVDELVGRSIDVLHRPQERAAVQERLARCFQQPGTVHRWEICKLSKHGDPLWVRESARVVENQQGARVMLAVCEDITEARDLSQQLSYQATHDALTGLVNRREFENRLRRVIGTVEDGTSEHALCYLDLDQFKVINDTCGHVAGDELLRQLGALLQQQVRKRDMLARLGGDEFGVLLERCSLAQARRVAKAIRKAIQTFKFVWEEKSFGIGVSIGLVPITAASGGIARILSAADTACYAAKDAGTNRIHVYREDDADLARRYGEMQWVARINRALEEDRFYLVVQPIAATIPGAGGEHYELLLRMEDENGDTIWPSSFLPAAERYNLSAKIDRWVVGTALDWFSARPEPLQRLYLCSINLSGHSLGDEAFLEFVIRKFDESGVPPAKICFEITETVAIINMTNAKRFIGALKELGCHFALDDFGSGLSSFAYLKNLPVDFIKIDGLFVRDIVDDPIALAMVNSINAIGHVMGKQTIAEFAENESILAKLRAIGVDYVQGYAVGRPRAAERMKPLARGTGSAAAD